jgi:hypothetical protein
LALKGIGKTAFVLTAWLLSVIPLGAQETKPPLGDLEVTVVIEGGKSFKECRLYVYDRAVDVEDKGVPITIKGLPAKKTAVTADALVRQGWFRPYLRHIGVETAWVPENKMAKVTVTLRSVGPMEENIIDSFCLTCHPEANMPAEKWQIPRDVHKSGTVLKPKFINQIKQYNENIARLEKAGKPHFLPIKTVEKVVEENGKRVRRTFLTCESCHTLHLQTPYSLYVVASFRDKGFLCVACHS